MTARSGASTSPIPGRSRVATTTAEEDSGGVSLSVADTVSVAIVKITAHATSSNANSSQSLWNFLSAGNCIRSATRIAKHSQAVNLKCIS